MKPFENLKIMSLKLVLLLIVFCVKMNANVGVSAQAEKFYEQKKYNEAIIIYDSILSQKLISSKLYYNLGNCYFKTNQLGKAIYNYELSRKLIPNDADVKINLKLANTKTIDKIETKENYFLGAIKSNIINLLSSNGWAWLSIISLIISLTLLFLFFITKTILIKRTVFFVCLFSVTLFISSIILGYSSISQKGETNFGIILSREIKVHIEPNKQSESKFSLHEGTKVLVLNNSNNWINIKLDNGNEGWLEASSIGLF